MHLKRSDLKYKVRKFFFTGSDNFASDEELETHQDSWLVSLYLGMSIWSIFFTSQLAGVGFTVIVPLVFIELKKPLVIFLLYAVMGIHAIYLWSHGQKTFMTHIARFQYFLTGAVAAYIYFIEQNEVAFSGVTKSG